MVEATGFGINDNNERPEGLQHKPEGGGTEPPRIGGFEVHTPGEFSFESAPPKRKRGRPAGSRNSARTDTEKAPQNNLIESFESLLLSVHFMAAKLLDVAELELDESEAKRLSDAFKKIAEFYPMGLSPKRLAWAELSIAAGTIYGPRIVTIYKKKPKQNPQLRVMPNSPQQSPNNPQQQRPQQSPPARPAPQGPQVPSQMWNQDAVENASDQA
jgi:hypothetical protein